MSPEQSIAYLNGQFIPIQEAKVSVLDRGFLFGDGVYEVIPAYGGKLFRLHEHLNRLENSLKKIRMDPPLAHTEWEHILNRLVKDKQDQSVYLQITRGVVDSRDHRIPTNIKPTVFAQCTLLTPFEIPVNGFRAITLPDTRWNHCDIKAITLLANSLLRQEAIDRNCSEAILIRDHNVTEGAASNVFAVTNNILTTPPQTEHLLPGITRDLVLELALENNIQAKEIDISLSTLRQADEIWITSSTREILPIVELDGKAVGTGKIGALWYKMVEIFQTYKQSLQQ